jgi:hypothetical protein
MNVLCVNPKIAGIEWEQFAGEPDDGVVGGVGLLALGLEHVAGRDQ